MATSRTTGWAPVDDAMPSWRWWTAVATGALSAVLVTPLGNAIDPAPRTVVVAALASIAVLCGLVPTIVRAWREVASGSREGGTGGPVLITGALIVAAVLAIPAAVTVGSLQPLAAAGVATVAHLVAARILRGVVGVVPGGETSSTAGASTRGWAVRVDRLLPWVPVVVAAIALLTFGSWLLLGVVSAGDTPVATLAAGLTGGFAMLAVLLVASPASFFLARFLPSRAARDRGRELGVVFGEVDLLEVSRIRSLVLDPLGTVSDSIPRLTRVRTSGRLPVTAALQAAASVADGGAHPHHVAVVAAARERAIDLRPSAAIDPDDGATRRRRIKDTVVTLGPAQAFDRVPAGLAEGGVDLFVGWDGAARAGFALSPQVRTDVLDQWPELRSMHVTPVFVGRDHGTMSQIARATETPLTDVHADWDQAVRGAAPRGPVAVLGDAPVETSVLRLAAGDPPGLDVAPSASTIRVETPDLLRAVRALGLARKTHRVTVQGLVGVAAVHLAVLPLAALGLLTPTLAVAIGAGLPLLAAANALRPRSFDHDENA